MYSLTQEKTSHSLLNDRERARGRTNHHHGETRTDRITA